MTASRRAVIGAALIAGTVLGAGAAWAQQITLRYGHYLADSAYLQVEKDFAAAVAERTNGDVQIEITYSGGLGAGPELLPLAGRGAIDMGAIVPGYFGDQLQFWRIFQIPFIFDTPTEALEVSRAAHEELSYFSDELSKFGVKFLFHQPLGQYYFSGPEPGCDTVAGLQGKKIRSFGSDIPKLLDAVGAVPVTVPVPDVYESLQRGAIDYSFINRGNILANRLYEVAPNNCGPIMAIAGHLIVISERSWARLSEEQQAIILEEAQKAGEAYMAAIGDLEDSAEAKIVEAGGSFAEFSDAEMAKWRDMAPDVLAQWAENMADMGLGEEAQEVVSFVRERTGD